MYASFRQEASNSRDTVHGSSAASAMIRLPNDLEVFVRVAMDRGRIRLVDHRSRTNIEGQLSEICPLYSKEATQIAVPVVHDTITVLLHQVLQRRHAVQT
jgi:hypothetical protein